MHPYRSACIAKVYCKPYMGTIIQLLVIVHRKILMGEKLANLVNCDLFAKIFLTNIHRCTENVFGICTDCSLFPKFFLANNFYLYGLPKFPYQTFFVYSTYGYMVGFTWHFLTTYTKQCCAA